VCSATHGSTFVLSYESTFVSISVRKYESILSSYESTKVRKYFESTKVKLTFESTLQLLYVYFRKYDFRTTYTYTMVSYQFFDKSCTKVRKYFRTFESTFICTVQYGSTEVRKYFRTFESTKVLSKVLSYHTSVRSTKVLSYFRTKVRKYRRRCGSTEVRK
jgi:hypothetical protein